jgi:hypothetical protein
MMRDRRSGARADVWETDVSRETSVTASIHASAHPLAIVEKGRHASSA